VKIILPGKPIPKHRPRFTKRGFTYDDQSKIMKKLSILAKSQYPSQEPINSPISINVIFYMPIPKSLSNKKRQMLNGAYHHSRPDLDNLVKTLDILNKIIFSDDALVSEIYACKKYSLEPRTEIKIELL